MEGPGPGLVECAGRRTRTPARTLGRPPHRAGRGGRPWSGLSTCAVSIVSGFVNAAIRPRPRRIRTGSIGAAPATDSEERDAGRAVHVQVEAVEAAVVVEEERDHLLVGGDAERVAVLLLEVVRAGGDRLAVVGRDRARERELIGCWADAQVPARPVVPDPRVPGTRRAQRPAGLAVHRLRDVAGGAAVRRLLGRRRGRRAVAPGRGSPPGQRPATRTSNASSPSPASCRC